MVLLMVILSAMHGRHSQDWWWQHVSLWVHKGVEVPLRSFCSEFHYFSEFHHCFPNGCSFKCFSIQFFNYLLLLKASYSSFRIMAEVSKWCNMMHDAFDANVRPHGRILNCHGSLVRTECESTSSCSDSCSKQTTKCSVLFVTTHNYVWRHNCQYFNLLVGDKKASRRVNEITVCF